MFKKNKLVITLVLAFASAMALYACGDLDPTDAGAMAGPAGPTTSGYYFKFYESQTGVEDGGSILFSAYVYDSTSQPVADITVGFNGTSGSTSGSTTDDGYFQAFFTIEGTGGSTQTMYASVEDKTLAMNYQVLP